MPPSNSSGLRYHAWWTACGWGFVALVVYLSLMRPPGNLDARTFDAGHVIAYGWLMTWFAQIRRTTGARLVVGALLCALGAAIEILQGVTGYRTFDYADMGMNAVGVGVGLLLARTPAQNLLRALERRFTH